jgi:hypothetical protein
MNYLLLVCLLNKFKTIERIFTGAGGSGQVMTYQNSKESIVIWAEIIIANETFQH